MARIRTIKPEFWTSEQVVECSTTARLLFIGLWNFCDDHGNHPASLKTLKMEVFPGDCITPFEVGKLIIELQSQDLLVEYEAEGKRYWHVSGWYHQKVEKPNKKYPAYDHECVIPLPQPKFDDHSTTDPGTFDDHLPEEVDVEGSLREGKGNNPPLTPPMTLKEFRDLYRNCLGVELPGGCNFEAGKMITRYPRDRLEEALAIAADNGSQSFNYVKTVLEGRDKAEAEPDYSDLVRKYDGAGCS
jgi:hypothetical protein